MKLEWKEWEEDGEVYAANLCACGEQENAIIGIIEEYGDDSYYYIEEHPNPEVKFEVFNDLSTAKEYAIKELIKYNQLLNEVVSLLQKENNNE